VSTAVTRQRPFTLLYPSTRATASIEQLAEFLLDNPGAGTSDITFEKFWEKYMEVAGTDLKLPKRKKIKPAKAPDTVQNSSQSSLSKAPVSTEDNSLSAQVLASLNQLTILITDMSVKFKEFRHSRTEQTNGSAAPGDPENDQLAPQLPPIIPLDFEAYKKKKQNKA
jgi:flagellar biosynthesis protein FlhG